MTNKKEMTAPIVSVGADTEQAENLITDCLSNGKYPQQIILKKAQNCGISKRVLDEAKKNLGVISIKEGCQWYWELPAEKEAINF